MQIEGHSEDNPRFQCDDCGRLSLCEEDNFCPLCFYPSDKLIKVLSEISWSALRDGTTLAQVSWVDERVRGRRRKAVKK